MLCASYAFLTAPALTKNDVEALKVSMKHIKFKKKTVRRQTFLSMVESRNRAFSRAQVEQAFDAVDTDRSGAIDVKEWSAFVGEDKLSALAEHVESVHQVSEIVNALAPPRVQTLWEATKPTLRGLEDLVQKTRNAIDAAKEKLSEIDISLEFLDFLRCQS